MSDNPWEQRPRCRRRVAMRCQYPEPVTRGDPPHCREPADAFTEFVINWLFMRRRSSMKYGRRPAFGKRERHFLISGQLNNKEIGMIWDFLPPPEETQRKRTAVCRSFYCVQRTFYLCSDKESDSFGCTFGDFQPLMLANEFLRVWPRFQLQNIFFT